MIDTHCTFKKYLLNFYVELPSKLIKSIYRDFDVQNNLRNKEKMAQLSDIIFNIRNINIPEYIYDFDEFLFCTNFVGLDLYFIFANREQFYNFYTTVKSIENSMIRRNNNFPSWIKNLFDMYKYVYLEIIMISTETINNMSSFSSTFRKINNLNKTFVTKNK